LVYTHAKKATKEMRDKKVRGDDGVPENVLKTLEENGPRIGK